ncbi:MAG: response regulator transcription factor [Bacteroidales bacterium]|nr:response regulator transcription factor [Bacteroidales bacterium]
MLLPRCIVVDDEILAIERMCNLLSQLHQVELIDTALTPEKAIKEITAQKPDLVFVDVEMPRINGFEIVKQVQANLCFPSFVFVTAYSQYAIKAIKAEAFDFLLKPVDIDELHESINRYNAKQKGIAIPDEYTLTEREREILHLVAKGKTSKEIGEILSISKHTVDTHRRRILEKVGVKSTFELFSKLR